MPSLIARLLPAYAQAGVRRQVVVARRDESEHGRGPAPIERPLPGVEVARAYRAGVRFHRVGDLLARAPGDLVHAQHEVFLYGPLCTSLQFSLALREPRRRGRPVVVTVHGVPDLTTIDRGFVAANGSRVPPRLVRPLLRRLIGDAAHAGDAVIVHDEIFAERLVEQYDMPPARVHVVPHPVPVRQPRDRAQARATLGLDGPVALFFGFVTGYKGLPLLLEGWDRYRRTGGTGELLVAGGRHPRLAGTRSYETQYHRLMARAAAIEGVRWVGYIPDEDVPSYLEAADLMALPYRDALAASGPMSFALAYGLPVVGSDLLHAIVPHVGGVFERDPEAVATILHRALEGPLGPELRAASARIAAQRSLAQVARHTVTLYSRLAA